MNRVDKLIKDIKHFGEVYTFSKGNFVIVNVTEIGLNQLLIDSQSLSIAEMTNKIMEKDPSLPLFKVNIKMPFPKN